MPASNATTPIQCKQAAERFDYPAPPVADKLRGNLDAAEYKHVVLGLIFLKYISDAFESRRSQLETLCDDKQSDYFVDGDDAQKQAILEDRDECSVPGGTGVRADDADGQIGTSTNHPYYGSGSRTEVM